MNCLSQIKITPRDRQVLELLVLGCSNKEVAVQLFISPRTVKQHLRTLFLRAGIREGRKRVKLATAMFEWMRLDENKIEVAPCDTREVCASKPDLLSMGNFAVGEVLRGELPLGKELTRHATL